MEYYRGGSRYQDKKDYSLQSLDHGKQRSFRRKKQEYLIGFSVLFLILLLLCIGGSFVIYHHNASKISVSLEELDSPNAVLMDVKTGAVIGDKDADVIIFPASMTKILTVWIAAEQLSHLDETITMSWDYWDHLYESDASRAGFEPGEEVVCKDLLYGAMLPSGADCCMEIAYQVAGSEAAFAELMNQKVTALGLQNSHFTNCTGLHDDNQYTTAKEMALILRAALKNKTFKDVFTTKTYQMHASSIHPDGFEVVSSMFKYMPDAPLVKGEILGGKTGYTDQAGHCLASMARIKKREYILVTAGWAYEPESQQYHITDAVKAYQILADARHERTTTASIK